MHGVQPPSDERTAVAPVSPEQRQIADSLPQLVWTCLPEGTCDFLSRRWVQYTGIPEAEQLGLAWLRQVHPEDRERTTAAWTEAVASARAFDVELRIRRYDGVHRWFRSVALPVRDQAGRIVKWFGTSTDIDDEKRAAEERERLLARAQRHAAEVEAILSTHAAGLVGLVIYGSDGEIRSMNLAARRGFGVPERDPTPHYREIMRSLRTVDAQGHPLEPEQVPSRRALRGESVQGVLVEVCTPNGRGWSSVSAAPLRTADGTIEGAILTFVDVTHLRELQDEREQTIRTLTHDARTRLNVIQTHGELLGRANVTEAIARRRAELIVSNAQRLSEMIDTLVGGR